MHYYVVLEFQIGLDIIVSIDVVIVVVIVVPMRFSQYFTSSNKKINNRKKEGLRQYYKVFRFQTTSQLLL